MDFYFLSVHIKGGQCSLKPQIALNDTGNIVNVVISAKPTKQTYELNTDYLKMWTIQS